MRAQTLVSICIPHRILAKHQPCCHKLPLWNDWKRSNCGLNRFCEGVAHFRRSQHKFRITIKICFISWELYILSFQFLVNILKQSFFSASLQIWAFMLIHYQYSACVSSWFFFFTHPHTCCNRSNIKESKYSLVGCCFSCWPMMQGHTHIQIIIQTIFLVQVLKALLSKIHPLSSLWYSTVRLVFSFQSIHVYSVSCSLELLRDTLNGWSC